MMTTDDEEKISGWGGGAKRPVSITCHVSKDHRTGMFKTFCQKLSQLAPDIRVHFKHSDDRDAAPSIEIHKRLIHHAIPEGPELNPFLDGLTRLSGINTVDGPESESRLADLKSPAFLKLFIAPQCVFCPKMVRALTPMALSHELVSLTVIDAFLFPEMAKPFDIKSVPTLLLNDQMRWSGVTHANEILRAMISRDPSELSADAIQNLLEDGRAGLVVQMMISEGKIFPAFIDTLIHEKWPVRLGAMVAAEEIAEEDGNLSSKMVDALWKKFHHLDGPVRGDVAYVLGIAGSRDTIPRLETILSGPYDDETREAAKEAIETINGFSSELAG